MIDLLHLKLSLKVITDSFARINLPGLLHYFLGLDRTILDKNMPSTV